MKQAYKNWTYSDATYGTHVFTHDNYNPDVHDLDQEHMKWGWRLEDVQAEVEDQEAEWAEARKH